MIRLITFLLALTLAPAVQADVFRREKLRLPDVELLDQNGERHRLGAGGLEGLMVITFAYTTCESICPIGNEVMREIDETLGPDPGVRLVTITIDPSHDTPAVMRRAAREMNASGNWLWLTGAPEGIDRLLGVLDARADELFLHEPLFLVGDPATGRLYRSQSLPLAEEVLDILGQWSS
ncbi:SCO family protein [Paenirhodobacter sp.]|uniref:SCO family protein n=1 Tax=Paenirhodobacter sp. TaxID=1965326 RepID=UPI003B3CFC07